jgi:hypothetical protein
MPRPHRIKLVSSDEVKKFFPLKLAEAQAWLRANGVEYRVLGSVATSSYLDGNSHSSLDFGRKGAFEAHQRMPDVDVVIPMADIPRVQVYRDQLEKDPEFPINLEILPAQCHFDFRPDEETTDLVHRRLHVPVPTRLFNPVERIFLGTPIVTVDPNTLFHTYVLLGGMLRDKDYRGAAGLARIIRDGGSEFAEAEYQPFHRFLAERTCQYPSYQRYRIAAHYVRNRVPGWMHYWGVYYGKFIQPIVFGNK